MSQSQVLVIVGPTASGKSDLAVKLAKKFDGEVISADSRQVYKGMDLGSGKITKKEMRGVPHHLLDVANPKKQFSAAEYQKLAQAKIQEILSRGKLPIICGGTGFYVQAVVDNLVLPAVPPNKRLRAELCTLSTEELFARLKKLDPTRAKTIDPKNPRRLIRAIEIATALGKIPSLRSWTPKWEFLQIGLNPPPEVLKKKIRWRILARMKKGMLEEVVHLHRQGVSWKKLESFGLEYRYLAIFLREHWRDFGDASEPFRVKREEIAPVLEGLERATWHYVKRQMTWFKRDKRIRWFKSAAEASDFLKKIS